MRRQKPGQPTSQAPIMPHLADELDIGSYHLVNIMVVLWTCIVIITPSVSQYSLLRFSPKSNHCKFVGKKFNVHLVSWMLMFPCIYLVNR